MNQTHKENTFEICSWRTKQITLKDKPKQRKHMNQTLKENI